MKAITWTQVSQYIVVLLAFLAPMSWLAYKQLGNPVAAVAYDSHLQAIADMETRLLAAPEELQVRQEFERRAQVLEYKLSNVAQNLEQERQLLQERVRYLRSIHSDMASIVPGQSRAGEPAAHPRREPKSCGRSKCTNTASAPSLEWVPRHTLPFAGDPEGSPQEQPCLINPGATFWL